MVRRCLFLVAFAAASGCSSGDLGDTPSESGVDDDSASSTETSSDSATEDTGTEDTACGTLACEETKVFHPLVKEAFDRLGGKAQVGDPHDNGGGIYVHAWGAGFVQDFDGGALGPTVIAEATGSKSAYGVHGAIRTTWLALGGEGKVGYPLEDEHAGPGGEVQRFEKGCIGPDGSGGFDLLSACEDPPDLGPTLDSIETKASSSAPGTDFGIAVSWLPTGKRWSARGDVARNSASSAKWIWSAAALAKNDVATVETPALPTFKDSNNSTAGQLIDLAGGPDAVNDFTSKTLGIPTTAISLCHWSYDKTRNATNCSDALGGENFFTPNGVVAFLEKVWKGDAGAGDKRAKLLEWSTLSPRTGYGGWVGTQLPTSTQTAMHHKAGWLPTGCCGTGFPAHYNEIAIVPTSRGHYAVVLSMRGGTDSKMTKTLEWASCVVFHTLAKDSDPSSTCTAP
ncbi:MAG: serine hydrolase [Polyangiales bacterium]